jgi:hypothetical protein
MAPFWHQCKYFWLTLAYQWLIGGAMDVRRRHHVAVRSAIAPDGTISTMYIADTRNSAVAEVLGLAKTGDAADR